MMLCIQTDNSTATGVVNHRVNFILRQSQAVNWIALSILTFDGLDSLLKDRHHDELYANDFKS